MNRTKFTWLMCTEHNVIMLQLSYHQHRHTCRAHHTVDITYRRTCRAHHTVYITYLYMVQWQSSLQLISGEKHADSFTHSSTVHNSFRQCCLSVRHKPVQSGDKSPWDYVETSYFTQLKMLPNDNVLMSAGHLDHVLIVYSPIEHVTWKSPGPMCGWVGRILHPDSCTTVSSWSKVPL